MSSSTKDKQHREAHLQCKYNCKKVRMNVRMLEHPIVRKLESPNVRKSECKKVKILESQNVIKFESPNARNVPKS